MAALNSRKMKYSLMRGPFSETGINEFLRELSVGRGSTATLQGSALPRVATVTPWDGKDKEVGTTFGCDLIVPSHSLFSFLQLFTIRTDIACVCCCVQLPVEEDIDLSDVDLDKTEL